ncbi:MAG TPA: MarR family transcriptional regulator [Nocardioidaceae bacterium]|jgi:DNA-binding MarR family transcriptional regulator|nr:MarR family transcriptional regulator [Nocardioidaceae bacterium]
MTDQTLELAAGVRNVVVRLAYSLRSVAARDGVTPTRLTALGILERYGPLRPSDVAARLNITAASMSRLADALEQGGWVERGPDPDDRRACLLSLSAHGTAALETLRRENAEELAARIRDMSDADREAIRAALPVLARLTEQLFDEHAGEAGSVVAG